MIFHYRLNDIMNFLTSKNLQETYKPVTFKGNFAFDISTYIIINDVRSK